MRGIQMKKGSLDAGGIARQIITNSEGPIQQHYYTHVSTLLKPFHWTLVPGRTSASHLIPDKDVVSRMKPRISVCLLFQAALCVWC